MLSETLDDKLEKQITLFHPTIGFMTEKTLVIYSHPARSNPGMRIYNSEIDFMKAVFKLEINPRAIPRIRNPKTLKDLEKYKETFHHKMVLTLKDLGHEQELINLLYENKLFIGHGIVEAYFHKNKLSEVKTELEKIGFPSVKKELTTYEIPYISMYETLPETVEELIKKYYNLLRE
jgi:hypothetical protein